MEGRDGDTEWPELGPSALSLEAPPAEDGSLATVEAPSENGNEILASSADDGAGGEGATLHDGKKCTLNRTEGSCIRSSSCSIRRSK